MALQFFEIVRIASSPRIPRLQGKYGVILAMGYENDDVEAGEVTGYAVIPDGEEETFDFLPDELEGTGELKDRSEFYTGESIRVRVIDGEGFLVDDQTGEIVVD